MKMFEDYKIYKNVNGKWLLSSIRFLRAGDIFKIKNKKEERVLLATSDRRIDKNNKFIINFVEYEYFKDKV
jgi:hypothetical protein